MKKTFKKIWEWLKYVLLILISVFFFIISFRKDSDIDTTEIDNQIDDIKKKKEKLKEEKKKLKKDIEDLKEKLLKEKEQKKKENIQRSIDYLKELLSEN